MNNLISLIPRTVVAQGLRKNNYDEEKIKDFFFQEEWEKLPLLKQLPQFPNTKISLLYPGSGADIFWPLYYLEHLFPQLEKAHLLFIDLYDISDMIKTVLDDVGMSFEEKEQNKGRKTIAFYWKDILVTVAVQRGNIFELLPILPQFNLYFEKAFRIMKEGQNDYEEKILQKLLPGGLIVSDSGFENMPLQLFSVPNELSAYGEMVVGRKIS